MAARNESTRISRAALAGTTALCLSLGIGGAACANPKTPEVVAGSVSISAPNANTLSIQETTSRAIINWSSFNIQTGQTVQFVQPNASAIVLNRVTGNMGSSSIDGSLLANGTVFIVNADGFLFGQNAQVNVGGLLATTADIANTDFMAGNYQFTIVGAPTASIVNLGAISVQNGGMAALVAPGVRNAGTITATLGKVALASGDRFTLDLNGDQLITFGIGDETAAGLIDAATGQPLAAAVSNSGTIQANGGTVALTATTAAAVLGSVINNTGVIEAQSLGPQNGQIMLEAATEATKISGAPTQGVLVSGTLDASGIGPGQTGGTVQAIGEAIAVSGATVNASGASGGGRISIGSLSQNVPLAASDVASPTNATGVYVDSVSTLNANALTAGNGGTITVWANVATTFAGSLLSTGGVDSGDGGSIEVSGHQTLSFTGTADTLAPKGSLGSISLDPGDVYIVNGIGVSSNITQAGNGCGETNLAPGVCLTANSTESYIGANTISSLLLTSAVDIASPNGSIYVNVPLNLPGNGLFLSTGENPAAGNYERNADTGAIYINAPITGPGSLGLTGPAYVGPNGSFEYSSIYLSPPQGTDAASNITSAPVTLIPINVSGAIGTASTSTPSEPTIPVTIPTTPTMPSTPVTPTIPTSPSMPVNIPGKSSTPAAPSGTSGTTDQQASQSAEAANNPDGAASNSQSTSNSLAQWDGSDCPANFNPGACAALQSGGSLIPEGSTISFSPDPALLPASSPITGGSDQAASSESGITSEDISAYLDATAEVAHAEGAQTVIQTYDAANNSYDLLVAFNQEDASQIGALIARDVVIFGLDTMVGVSATAVAALSTASGQPEGYLGTALIIVEGSKAANSAGNFTYYVIYGTQYKAAP